MKQQEMLMLIDKEKKYFVSIEIKDSKVKIKKYVDEDLNLIIPSSLMIDTSKNKIRKLISKVKEKNENLEPISEKTKDALAT